MSDRRTASGIGIRSPQNFAGGIFLICIGLGAYLLAGDLAIGTLRAMGPGMLPKAFALILAGLGALLVVESLRFDGEALERFSLRGIVFVLGGCLLFGMAIRGFEVGPLKVPSLGLVLAGPLVMFVAGFASDEVRWKEIGIFAIVMTALCAALFKYALGLPIPLAPWLIGI
jgi:Tripartite tricarboxylate transporter TctB family